MKYLASTDNPAYEGKGNQDRLERRHLLRLACDGREVENMVVPVWISWIGLAIVGDLAYQGFRSSRS